MPDASQIPHLVALLDDESHEIQTRVLSELAAFGDTLTSELNSLASLTPDRVQQIALRIANWRESGRLALADGPLFRPGQLVCHRRYGYRGVVVSVDSCCRADPAWYQRNRTQPERDIPWYHVLVHGSDQVTYAAQTSLEADPEPRKVLHPLAPLFFAGFENGRYVRNDRPWPGWGEA